MTTIITDEETYTAYYWKLDKMSHGGGIISLQFIDRDNCIHVLTCEYSGEDEFSMGANATNIAMSGMQFVFMAFATDSCKKVCYVKIKVKKSCISNITYSRPNGDNNGFPYHITYTIGHEDDIIIGGFYDVEKDQI